MPRDDVAVLKRKLTEDLPAAERRKLEKFLNRLGRAKKGGRK